MEEIWAQDSWLKGLRVIVFERISDDSYHNGMLKWLRSIDDDETVSIGYIYHELDLTENSWVRLE